MPGPIRKVGPFTQTVAALNSKPRDAIVGRTDRAPGDGQHLDRVRKRAAMGQKKTPMGGVKLTRKR